MLAAFRWYLLRVGLPIGLLIAFSEAISDQQVWWDVIVTVALPALGLASALALATEVLTRHVARSTSRDFAFVAMTTILTVVVGLALLVFMPTIPHGHWVRLPDPPRVVRAFAGPTCLMMVGSDVGVVVMESSDGGYVVYHPDRSSSWTIEPAIPAEIELRACRPMVTNDSVLPESSAPLVFGNVIARYRIEDIGADCGGRRHYLLKSDHTVWEWSTGGCAIGWLGGVVLYLSFLVLLGVLVGVRARSGFPIPTPPSGGVDSRG